MEFVDRRKLLCEFRTPLRISQDRRHPCKARQHHRLYRWQQSAYRIHLSPSSAASISFLLPGKSTADPWRLLLTAAATASPSASVSLVTFDHAMQLGLILRSRYSGQSTFELLSNRLTFRFTSTRHSCFYMSTTDVAKTLATSSLRW